jgi:hypothetical protein
MHGENHSLLRLGWRIIFARASINQDTTSSPAIIKSPSKNAKSTKRNQPLDLNPISGRQSQPTKTVDRPRSQLTRDSIPAPHRGDETKLRKRMCTTVDQIYKCPQCGTPVRAEKFLEACGQAQKSNEYCTTKKNATREKVAEEGQCPWCLAKE